jgi:hypothetical protein
MDIKLGLKDARTSEREIPIHYIPVISNYFLNLNRRNFGIKRIM